VSWFFFIHRTRYLTRNSILAVNTYAMRTIEEASEKKASVFDILIPRSNKSKDVVAKTFADTMGVLSANLARLILEAESNLANLNNLEEHLSTLHDLVTRENITTVNARDDLLSELWTVFGGNRKELRTFQDHLKLLKDVGSYRKKALVHVTAALETLRSMSDDMEDLRERVATPELIGPSLPMEVHIQSIQNGITRLQEGRDKAKRIEADAVIRVQQEDEELMYYCVLYLNNSSSRTATFLRASSRSVWTTLSSASRLCAI